MNSPFGDKAIKLSYLYNGISYTGKTTSLYMYWNRPLTGNSISLKIPNLFSLSHRFCLQGELKIDYNDNAFLFAYSSLWFPFSKSSVKIILPFYKDFSPSGEQLEHSKLAHEL